MILAISESPCCWKPSIEFLLMSIYGLEDVYKFQEGYLVHRHLWCVNRMIFAFSESPCCRKPNIQFLLKRRYSMEEDVGWIIQRLILREWPSWMCEWDDFGYSEFPCCRKASIKFLLKRTYGLEEAIGWKIPRWLLSAWPSLTSEWGNFSYFWVSFLLEAFHQVSAQEYMVWKKMLVEEFQQSCLMHGNL